MTLNKAINAGLAEPKVTSRFKEFDSEPLIMSPTEFASFMKSEAVRWGKAVKDSGAKPE
jgi:tripartite-type tricarboxylate transporter receptor subunit TctC